jgi:hypothetical protein
MNLDQIPLKGLPGWPVSLALRVATATLTVHGPGRDGFSEESGGEAAFTLHSPHLGTVEMRIRLDAAGGRAAVTTPPGPMSERAAATLPDLVAALERATGRTGIASVQPRRGSKPGPMPRKVPTMATPERVPDVVSPPPSVAAAVPLRIAPDAPPELYRAVADALVWAYRLAGAEPPA